MNTSCLFTGPTAPPLLASPYDVYSHAVRGGFAGRRGVPCSRAPLPRAARGLAVLAGERSREACACRSVPCPPRGPCACVHTGGGLRGWRRFLRLLGVRHVRAHMRYARRRLRRAVRPQGGGARTTLAVHRPPPSRRVWRRVRNARHARGLHPPDRPAGRRCLTLSPRRARAVRAVPRRSLHAVAKVGEP
eukprot:6173180-Pleurochrysis_carterae.AAC.2